MSQEDRYAQALDCLDRIFKHLPDYKDFMFARGVLHANENISIEEKKEIETFSSELETISFRLKYVERATSSNIFFHLTPLGRDVKEAGGITKYNESLLEQKKQEKYVTELQLRKLEGEIVDLSNKINNFKPSNRRANAAIIIAILSLLAAIVLGVLKMK